MILDKIEYGMNWLGQSIDDFFLPFDQFIVGTVTLGAELIVDLFNVLWDWMDKRTNGFLSRMAKKAKPTIEYINTIVSKLDEWREEHGDMFVIVLGLLVVGSATGVGFAAYGVPVATAVSYGAGAAAISALTVAFGHYQERRKLIKAENEVADKSKEILELKNALSGVNTKNEALEKKIEKQQKIQIAFEEVCDLMQKFKLPHISDDITTEILRQGQQCVKSIRELIASDTKTEENKRYLKYVEQLQLQLNRAHAQVTSNASNNARMRKEKFAASRDVLREKARTQTRSVSSTAVVAQTISAVPSVPTEALPNDAPVDTALQSTPAVDRDGPVTTCSPSLIKQAGL